MQRIQPILTALTLLILPNFTPGAIAQTPLPAGVTQAQILDACANNRVVQDLPNPYTDVTPQDWAYEAVLKMYYCGAYRGAIPPQQYQEFLERQQTQGSEPSRPVSTVLPLNP
ncbi:S-layer protein [Geitlerinema splendidum]|nr:S-layer protein [Geitlerinema splendidum]